MVADGTTVLSVKEGELAMGWGWGWDVCLGTPILRCLLGMMRGGVIGEALSYSGCVGRDD